MKVMIEKPTKNQKGQTFLEFIFLILVIVSISFTFMNGIRSFVGTRWELMVKMIAAPNPNEVNMP